MNKGELVPDRTLKQWHPTNPRAYKALFDRRALLKPTFVRAQVAMQQRDEAKVEPFPIREAVKGILRRIVQLLKRHRDIFYENNTEDVAPFSVIITTLAMQAYEYCVRRHVFVGEMDVLVEVIRMMPHFIERPILDGRQGYAVPNETTHEENFADNWNKDPRRAPAFYTWHAQALLDFEARLPCASRRSPIIPSSSTRPNTNESATRPALKPPFSTKSAGHYRPALRQNRWPRRSDLSLVACPAP